MSERFDIVIVGARCAGACLATLLARAGARVALFDRDPLPSEYVLSTHTIHPPGMDVLDEVGVGNRVRAITPAAHIIRFGIDGIVLDSQFRDGRLEYCPRRHYLDAWLQEAAVAAGARLFDRTRVIDVLRSGGRVAGVRVRDAAGERNVEASQVVGADGRHSTIAERVGAREYLGYDAPRAFYWSYWPAPADWADKTRFPFDMYIGRIGTAVRTIFPTNDNQLLLGTAPQLDLVREWKRDLPAAYRNDLRSDPVIRPIVDENAPVTEIRGTIKERYYFREATGPGWVLVGDAGHHKDYLIGDGITEALLQARTVALAIRQGSDAALVGWWRDRDAEAVPMFRFAEDQGRPTATPKLVRRIFARLSRTPGGARILDALDRRVSPFDDIPMKVVIGAMFDGAIAGEFGVFREFLMQGRRIAAVQKERDERIRLVEEFANNGARA